MTPKLLVPTHCKCGENPLWDADAKCFYWTDIPSRVLYRCGADGEDFEVFFRSDQMVGGFTLQADGSLLLFRENDIVRLDETGVLAGTIPFDDRGAERFNDVIADPQGRVFAGTIGKTEDSGALYRLDHYGRLRLLFRGTKISNGMGFSGDLLTFYWTCSTTGVIFRFSYDDDTGNLAGREVFYTAKPDEGTPDGMTVDTEDFIWSARFGGSSIHRHAPDDGRIVETVSFPVERITACTFGGDDHHELYATTAGGSDGSDTEDGAIYKMTVNATGRPEFRSRILL